MRRWLVVGGAVAAVAVAVTVGVVLTGGSSEPEPGVVRISGPLPAVSGTTLEGRAFTSEQYRGRVLVLNFWNPYCTPCRAEATVLDLAHGALAPSGVVLVGVLFSNRSFPHDLAAARRFARELGERYPTIDDAGGAIADAFSVRGIPSTVIADAAGHLRYEVLGPLKKGELESLVRRVQRRP